MDKIKIQQIKPDALVNIQISASFLTRCQYLLLKLAEDTGPEELKKLFEKFANTQEPAADQNEETIFILTALIGEVEKAALAQGFVETKEYSKEEVAEMAKKLN